MLKEASMVEIEKGTSGKPPADALRLTRTGRKRFLEYIGELERVVSKRDRPRARLADGQTAGENGAAGCRWPEFA
jgi:hypothetical protein